MEEKTQTLAFDFDQWSAIAKENPAKFEAIREEMIQQVLETSPRRTRRRLQGLQWRIDRERELAANPLAACLNISNMMWQSLLGEKGLLAALETPQKILVDNDSKDTRVLPFNGEKGPGIVKN